MNQGYLTLIRNHFSKRHSHICGQYRCICGSIIVAENTRVNSGHKQSCGCIHRQQAAKQARNMGKQNTTHGQCSLRSGSYKSWFNMKQRCRNPHAINYANYGGRGVTVCDRWVSSFENFYEDMGDRPICRSLDRIDSNGNYGPGNCRWATAKEQASNRRKRETIR